MRAVFLFVTTVLVSAGCAGVVSFDIDRDIEEQVQRGDPIANAAGRIVPDQSPIRPFVLNIDLTAEAMAHRVTGIQRVFLRHLSFTVTATARSSPSDNDCWDFIDRIEVQVESTRSGSSLPRRTIATAMRPGCVDTLTFSVTSDVDLRPYIEEGIRFVTHASGIPPADDVSFRGRVTVRAEAL